MKVKKYEVTLTNPEAVHIARFYCRGDIERLFADLDDLWRDLDFEEWTIEISPFWEEVPEDGCMEVTVNA